MPSKHAGSVKVSDPRGMGTTMSNRPASGKKKSNRPSSAAKRRPASASDSPGKWKTGWTNADFGGGEPSHQADLRPRDSTSMPGAARGKPPWVDPEPRAALKRLPGQVPGSGAVVRTPLGKAGIVQGGPRVRMAGLSDPLHPHRLVRVEDQPKQADEWDAAVSAVAGSPEPAAAPPRGAEEELVAQKEEHKVRVETLKKEHREKVDSLMRSIHKLQDNTKALRRADKENRRSKLIVDLQNTIGEQEAVIRAMIRSLTASGFTDAQFAEVFKGKKKLRDVDAIETGLRSAERGKESAEKKLKSLEARYTTALETREQVESEYEEQITEWKMRASSAEELNQQLDAARSEAEGSKARAEELAAQMQGMQAESEQLRINAKAREGALEEQMALLEEYQQTIEGNEVALAEHTQKARQMRAALKAQEKIIAQASGGGVINAPPASSAAAPRSHGRGMPLEDHEADMERVRRISLSERETLVEEHAASLRRLERQWELRLEGREAEVEATRQRERKAAAAELEVWKQSGAGGSGKGDGASSLQQSRSEIVSLENSRAALEAELAKERARREELEAREVSGSSSSGGGSGGNAGVSRQLAAAKLVAKDSARQLELAQDELAVAQAENGTRQSQLSAASRDVSTAEGKLGAALDRVNAAWKRQRQLQASYDRLLAAFAAKCASLTTAQDAGSEAHEKHREQLTTLGAAPEGVAAALQSDFEAQLSENKSIIGDLRSDIDEQQAAADQLRALLAATGDASGEAATEAVEAADPADPQVAALQPADFTVTQSDLIDGGSGASGAPGSGGALPSSSSLAEDLERNAQFRAGLDGMLVE